jgi:hypothetical protein
MPLPGYWKKRALDAEAKIAAAGSVMEVFEQRIKALPVLASITRDGRHNNFTFTRNGKVIVISAYGTWDDDVDGWKRDLLE